MNAAEQIVRPGTEHRWRERISRNSRALPCGCRLWTGKCVRSRTGAPYPVVTVRLPGVRHPLNRRVHRIVAELNFGPLPFGFEVDHACGNTLCIADEHVVGIPRDVNRALVGEGVAS